MVNIFKNDIIIQTPENCFLQHNDQFHQSIDFTTYTIPKNSTILLDGYRCEITQKQLVNYSTIKSIHLLFKLKISHYKTHNDWRFYYIYKLNSVYYLVTTTMANIQFTSDQYHSTIKYNFLINTYQKTLDNLKKNSATHIGFIIAPYFGGGWRILCYKNFVIFFVKYVKNNSVSLEQLIIETKLYLSNLFGTPLNDINYYQENIDFERDTKNSTMLQNFVRTYLFQLFLTPKQSTKPIFLSKVNFSILFNILLGLFSATQIIYLSLNLLNFYRLFNSNSQKKVILHHEFKQLNSNNDQLFQKIQYNLYLLNYSSKWFKRFKQLSNIITPTLIIKELVWQYNTTESLQVRFRTLQDWDAELPTAQWQKNCSIIRKLWRADYNIDISNQTIKIKFND